MLKVQDIMTKEPASSLPETSLQDVAKMMIDCDCGEIPIIEAGGKVIGVVTDRDIVCRTLALGRNPLELRARDAMSSPVVTIQADRSLEECAKLLEHNKIRRVPVIDGQGKLIGIVAQADMARNTEQEGADVLREVSKPSDHASNVGITH
jgi:CBS domain-containing protein